MLRLAFDFIITWRETRTRPNAYLIRLYLSCKTIKQNNHEDKTFTWSTTVISLYNYFF